MIDINTLKLDWSVGKTDHKGNRPTDWLPATVPGAVQLDYLPRLPHEDWEFSDRVRQFDGLEDNYWFYKATFDLPSLEKDEHLFLESKGIDYQYEIILNNVLVGQQEGMFSRLSVDLTDHLQAENVLEIVVFPAPKSIPYNGRGRMQADQSTKPAVSYEWDWHPRLIPLGIWYDTQLVIKNKYCCQDLSYYYHLDESLDVASINISGISLLDEGTIQLEIQDAGGKLRYEKTYSFSGQKFSVEDDFRPDHLWWPYELGEPYLYSCHFQMKNKLGEVVDRRSWKWGFRRVRLVMNENAWYEPSVFPKSRSNPPITLEVNGVRLFAKGTNWVNPEIFPGRLNDDRYEELLQLAKNAHFNILRIWGGGIVNKDYFHRWCDEHGMMVWQEFPLACNDYRDTTSYLKQLRKEASNIIKRLRNHCSTVLWCGGNELFNSWSGMTDQSKALRLLNALCLELDSDTPFLPTSPVMGMGHGHYLFWDEDRKEDVFQLMHRSNNTAYTEFGMPSPASMKTLNQIIPKEELKVPVEESAAWTIHHAFHAWQGNTWLCEEIIRKYFPDVKDLEHLVDAGQKLQAIGYRAIYEMSRQQWPQCSMALNWCFNEPWPTAANNSIIEYSGHRKLAYEAIKLACRPVMVSARFPKFTWNTGENFNFQLFFFNHQKDVLHPGEVVVYTNGILQLRWEIDKIESHETLPGPTINFPITEQTEELHVEIKCVDPSWDSTYLLNLRHITLRDRGT
ncbi:MAG: hypothetical protein KI790_16635, partial [Cyclobacteriaceae bacterium]|nr:hypothetical protein [Cyclobacteriaceae bacterium HetDA_MAG_MS6]